jgi:hypothetical protein
LSARGTAQEKPAERITDWNIDLFGFVKKGEVIPDDVFSAFERRQSPSFQVPLSRLRQSWAVNK